MSDFKFKITPKQAEFINSTADEVLYGGAAGGGKSYGQLIDMFLYAMNNPKSKQIIFRRTFPELEMSLIRTALEIYPNELFKYNSSSHTGTFINGSIIDFAYCDAEKDVYRYQSAEFDVIRFDELTHFTETMYLYMISRLRGANNYKKSVKSTTNPGGIGHNWVKKRFIDIGEPNKEHKIEYKTRNRVRYLTRIFIPAKVYDNTFLLDADADYVTRLENLPKSDKKALLHGDWDIFEGQYFSEFDREIHVIKPFEIPNEWRIYRSIDYGLDMLAVLWIAVDTLGSVYVFRELALPDTPISEGCKLINELTQEDVYETFAPPDLWARSQESGRCKADIFEENGLYLTKSNNNREAGWLSLKELLKLNAEGEAKLKIFSSCNELIRCLPALQYDKKRPSDCATAPHDITHIPDALRYFAVQWALPASKPKVEKTRAQLSKERLLKQQKRQRYFRYF